ncbi:uncharacterized protein LOC116124392 [Pistacia vera]|uniref:uncharacterized protein LOC116124392 n=1 Tax=Pistacia vera TaxID=55513 RepID=UPI0012632B1D|nr:uncharacterized protein LOC116124392 [Pistacia vera]
MGQTDPVRIQKAFALHASSVIKFNGFNYNEWSEQVEYYLGVQNLDLALMTEKPADLTENSTNEERPFHKEWERSNRLSLKYLRMTMVSEIKISLPTTEYAREFMRLAKETSQFEAADKSHTWALMSRLTTMKYDGSRSMYEHVTEMSTIAARIRNMGMFVDESFLVQFVINSLPPQFSPFQINYNTIKDKWNMTELQTKLVQEEERLKK